MMKHYLTLFLLLITPEAWAFQCTFGVRRSGYRGVVQSTVSDTPPSDGVATVPLQSDEPAIQAADSQESNQGVGLYRPIAEKVWSKIQQAFPSLQSRDYEPDLRFNSAPAKGGAPGTVVRMETRALETPTQTSSPVHYARMALLETMPPSTASDVVHADGIQVLNLVLFPNPQTDLPVWGADFVSLPGNKHLLLLDAQPMTDAPQYQEHWQEWYQQHDIAATFPWGGDMPEPVQQYVSTTALWTRFVVDEQASIDNPLPCIQGPLVAAVLDHLEIYLHLLGSATTKHAENRQASYIQYRLDNDPARPMLKSLFGEEWTERVLCQVLFPQQS